MKKIKNEKQIHELLTKYHILSYFTYPNLPFELYIFEKGEFLNNEIDPYNYFCFILSGSSRILHVREDGSTKQIATIHESTCFGDIEFATGMYSAYLVEILKKTYCLAIPLSSCRKQLENDPVFLRYVLRNIGEKMEKVTTETVLPRDLEERVLYYIRYRCENKTLQGVENTASALSCSKRQLLRILKKMCEEEILVKEGKGTYKLTQK